MFVVAVAYEKFKIHNEETADERNYKLVKKYLLTESSLAKSKLPILWIYMDYDWCDWLRGLNTLPCAIDFRANWFRSYLCSRALGAFVAGVAAVR